MIKIKRNKFLLGLIGIILFLTLWEIVSVTKNDPAIVDIREIFKALIKILIDKGFYKNLFSTIKIVFLGVAMAVLTGVLIGVLMDLFEPIKNLLTPLIDIFRNIPSITLFPILLVICGIGDASRIFVIFWTAIPPIILSSAYGLRTVDVNIIEAGKTNGANKIQIMRKLKFPLAMPEILNSVRIAIGSGFIAIVVAEMLGASSGLGYMVMWATNAFKYDETYAYIIIIAVLGAIVNHAMNIIIKKYERKLQ